MNKNKLIEVLKIQSYSYDQFRMFAYIIRQLKKLGCSYYVKDGNIYATKGNSLNYPCVVSHMDTVHPICEDLTVLEVNGNLIGFNSVIMAQTGIGGDDKVGIFIALQCLEKFDFMKSVFFRDEEVGCVGSYESEIDFFDDCNFVLQCDRKGNKDFITNASGIQLSGKDFQKDIKHIIKKHGYSFGNGFITDVMALKEIGVLCSMANISCGYYNPHQENEFVNLKDVGNCLNLVFNIIASLKKSYVCKTTYYKKPLKKDYNLKTYFGDDEIIDRRAAKQNCDSCAESAILTHISDYGMDVCEKCIKDYSNYYSREDYF